MKINLLLNSNDVRSGYLNMSPLAEPNDPDKIRCNPDNLSIYVDDGECEDFIATDMIDYVPQANKDTIMNHWMSKIALGGTLTIGGLDLTEVCRAITLRQISLQAGVECLYGKEIQRNSLIPAEQMRRLLEQKGYKIMEVKMIDLSYLIKAQRTQ